MFVVVELAPLVLGAGQAGAPLLDREVDLAGRPAPEASESVVGRLDEDPAGRLLLRIPLFAAPEGC
ncbi:hypothetical protein ACFVU3_36220 [Streptomyces sp. NPDC058052]|uniref:hypothetical protein n=1 Tax=Streptomyces sp. NPDC058052 TaxID=3346316 RepID=UPI0036E4313D